MARFNLNSFFALDAILRQPTLTDAAKSVHLSQPAMSLALKRLREFFSDELVRYERGRAILSPLAQQLRPKVEQILASSQEVIALSRSFNPAEDNRVFRIAAPAFARDSLLSRLIAAVAVEAPHVTIEAIDIQQELREARPDIAIIPLWQSVRQPARPQLLMENFACLCPSDAEVLTMDEAAYLSLDHVALSGGQEEIFWPEGSAARELLAARRVHATVQKLDALHHLVINRGLIATTTTRYAQQQAAMSPLLKTIAAPTKLVPVTFVAQASPNRECEPAIRWLHEQIELVAASITPPQNRRGLSASR